MRILAAAAIAQAVEEMCIQAAHILPTDTARALTAAAKAESGLSARALKLCLQNAQIAAAQKLPLCQDTGTAVIFAEVGEKLFIKGNLSAAITAGVRRGYKKGYLRKSIVADPLFDRKNTQDNTPPVVHYSYVKGDKLKLTLLLKGGGAENCSALKMFTPAAAPQDIEDYVLQTVRAAGSKACPPMVVGVGIGGNFEGCTILAKAALARGLGSKNKDKRYAKMERSLLKKINALKIGPQGFGGKTTALAVFINHAPCHMASLPVAINIGCHSNRHAVKIL